MRGLRSDRCGVQGQAVEDGQEGVGGRRLSTGGAAGWPAVQPPLLSAPSAAWPSQECCCQGRGESRTLELSGGGGGGFHFVVFKIFSQVIPVLFL